MPKLVTGIDIETSNYQQSTITATLSKYLAVQYKQNSEQGSTETFPRLKIKYLTQTNVFQLLYNYDSLSPVVLISLNMKKEKTCFLTSAFPTKQMRFGAIANLV